LPNPLSGDCVPKYTNLKTTCSEDREWKEEEKKNISAKDPRTPTSNIFYSIYKHQHQPDQS
jgi:hypothetical protein